MAQKKNIAETVRELIEPTVKELGYEIWDIDYSKIGTDQHLEITIDSEKGIDIDDCERVHRAIEPIIDNADPIDSFYYLDVSSPGLERVIRTPEHFKSCEGTVISLKLFAALDGKKSIVGTLSEYDAELDEIKITEESGEEHVIGRKQISKANVYFEM
jgi:ribosome maturation factor RimP